ncbi:MAG: lipopolysaccharide biosynthesis protein [Elusimicrobia bacterium]|nr:lipopolysaccharide biosynthesis protein [Elusimicrobiota bacterium]
MSRSRRFAGNVGWSLAGQGGTIAVNFIAIPYLLRGFGAEAYGVYLLVYVAGNYLGLFQFGAGLATIKYVAEAKAAGEDRALRQAVSHSAAIHFFGVGAAASALCLAAGPLSRSFFDVPPYYQERAVWLLRAAAVGGLFSAGSQWVAATFQGLQRFAWPSALALLQSLLTPLGLAAILLLGRGLGAAAVWYASVQAVVFALGATALLGALGEHRGATGRLSFRAFARYGLSFWPAALSGVAAGQIDKTFVAGLLGMADLTYYAVPSGILSRLQTLPSTISHALMPVLSESGRVDGREALTAVYLRATRGMLALCAPAVGLLFALMPQLLALWLGPAFGARAAPAARLLVAAQAFALIFHAPNALAGGLGGGRYASAAAWGQALLSLALWPVLIPRWGIAGAAAGSLAAQASAALFYLDAAHRRLLGLSWGRFLREAAAPVVLPAAALLALAWAGRGLAWTWPGFIGVGAGAGAAYAVLLWPSLPREDRRTAVRLIKRA